MAQSVIPYLTIKGASEAIAFYQKAFGANENMRMPADDGKRLMHASLSINGGEVFLSDEFAEQGGPAAPKPGDCMSVAVALALAKPTDVDATFKRAISAGATSIVEPSDQFWGARYALVADPFGHRWMLNAPLEQA